VLGPESGPSGLPCAISVPNLMTDRGVWVGRDSGRLNVRRLMYQSLIWAAELRDDASSLATALNAEDVERAANALIDSVWRDIELRRNFLGRQVLIDQPQAIELAVAQPRDARYHIGLRRAFGPIWGLRHARTLLPRNFTPCVQ